MDIHLLHTRDYKIPLLYIKALGSSSSPKSSFNTLTRHFNLSVFYVWCHLIQVFLYLYQVPETPGTPLALTMCVKAVLAFIPHSFLLLRNIPICG